MKHQEYYSYARDKKGCIIHIDDAKRGEEYYCLQCGNPMITKQGEKRKWHFAHKGNLGGCNHETYLHTTAKELIRKFFEKAPHFYISFRRKAICSVEECPLGVSRPCNWKSDITSFDLKKYYTACKYEKKIEQFKADLLLTGSEDKRSPILIEFCVKHQSTAEKLNSGLCIIEIHLESDDDIKKIIQESTITEDDLKIKFYNFKPKKERPDEQHQRLKFLAWINPQGYLICENNANQEIKCLTPNSSEIEASVFRIESTYPVDPDFACCKLAQSGLPTKLCMMCNFYRYNQKYEKRICILYNKKETPIFPYQSTANKCPYFKQKDYSDKDFSLNKESKIYP